MRPSCYCGDNATVACTGSTLKAILYDSEVTSLPAGQDADHLGSRGVPALHFGRRKSLVVIRNIRYNWSGYGRDTRRRPGDATYLMSLQARSVGNGVRLGTLTPENSHHDAQSTHSMEWKAYTQCHSSRHVVMSTLAVQMSGPLLSSLPTFQPSPSDGLPRPRPRHTLFLHNAQARPYR